MDIKTAFLQSNALDRTVCVKPPVEANVEDGYIWRLNKCVYGLADASRNWYLTVKDTLIDLGLTMSKYDQAVFSWYHDQSLQGVICAHVDGFLWSGSSYFEQMIISELKERFVVKSEDRGSFKYLGLQITQSSGVISIDQEEFSKSLEYISLSTKYDPNSNNFMI